MRWGMLACGALLLSACRIEPGAMLGGGDAASVDCAHREINAVGYGTIGEGVATPFGLGELMQVMRMEFAHGVLVVEFTPRTEAKGLPKVKSLMFQRLREDRPEPEYALIRNAICQDMGGGDSRNIQWCVLEKKGDANDGLPFYFRSMELGIGNESYLFAAEGKPMNCRETGAQVSEIYLGSGKLPSLIPAEMGN